ncbi:MAG: M20/M25/M40 family metallo-hydrolase [Acetobacterales bacterium]
MSTASRRAFPSGADAAEATLSLARDLVAIDSRYFVSNLPVAERIEAELDGFEVERIDYEDPGGVAKRALVAHKGPDRPAVALCGHMDTVPATGWPKEAFEPRVDGGWLYGLGSCDMKGPLAALIVAAQAAPADVPVTLLLTTDEDGGNKLGAKAIAARSEMVKRRTPKAMLIAEGTSLRPVRGHRASINFLATAHGVQAHSSTGEGENANLRLIPFLAEMLPLHGRLRSDASLQDASYDPPFCDFNITIDNHGTGRNVTVARASAVVKLRYSKRVDPAPVVEAVKAAAGRAGVELELETEGFAPELEPDHWLVRLAETLTGKPSAVVPYGTDASEIGHICPTIVLGPGTIDFAHKPHERIDIAELQASVPLFLDFARAIDERC